MLAKAGLLRGYRSTIHWENQLSLQSEFPDLEIAQELFEIDRNRFTCAGGTAAVDMMLSLIMRDHGEAIASEVTEQLIHHRIREASERQRMDLRARLGTAHPKMIHVVGLMEQTIEDPLSSHELGQPGAYQDVTEPSVYVRFPVVDRDFDLLVWTTTPWTQASGPAADALLPAAPARPRAPAAAPDRDAGPVGRDGLRLHLRLAFLQELRRPHRLRPKPGTQADARVGLNPRPRLSMSEA